ncbi:MAG TPA: adenylate/guanylate cyclase domain-containing protein [Candidatus Nitrosotalea sp.]|nr:adenylate/guanylate cyclase domain-containing protein [Candidatus Nitrosotalea sp.]
MDVPVTNYAKSGEVNIAYQVTGKGPLDLIYVPGWVSNVEYTWEEPSYARFLRRLASFSRLILFDKRGTGLSDRVPANELPTLEQRMDDLRGVLDAAGSERAAIFSISEGASLSILFAATYPQRTSGLALFGGFAKRLWSPDYPWAPTPERRAAWIDGIAQGWGGVTDLETIAPSRANDAAFARWWSTFLRQSASPGAAVALAQMNTEIDVRSLLASVHVPTLVIHRTGDLDANIAEGRYIADHIPDAKFVELPGTDHLVFAGDFDSVVDELQEFLTGVRRPTQPDRVLATVLLTDIARSTQIAAELGDLRWRDFLERHNTLARRELARFHGTEIKTTGDGFLATFDGPARAIQCALSLRESLRQLGMEIRAGLHTGECEILGSDIGGIAVHIAARVLSEAEPGEILASGTVRDLVAGSGIGFTSRGRRELRGVPGEWELLAVKT